MVTSDGELFPRLLEFEALCSDAEQYAPEAQLARHGALRLLPYVGASTGHPSPPNQPA